MLYQHPLVNSAAAVDALGLICFAEARATLSQVLVHVMLARCLVGAVGTLQLP